MNANRELIKHFYTCFQNKDYQAMQNCYADDATFSDTIFKNLNSAQVKAMWEMLIRKGKDLQIHHHSIEADERYGKAHWDASYIFSSTGKKVTNKIDARFEFKEGKIIRHIDHFDFYSWAKQALGFSGMLLGWTNFLRKKVSAQAMRNLSVFMSRNENGQK